MKAFRKTILFLLAWSFFVVGIRSMPCGLAAVAGTASSVSSAANKPKLYSTGEVSADANYNQWTSNNPFAVPTFHCISVYWSTRIGSADKNVLVDYRPKGASEWLQALPMRYNPIGTTTEDKADYRGSIVNLTPDTEYEIHLTLEDTSITSTLEARTWSEDFPIGGTVKVGNQRRQYGITASGTVDAYVLYDGTELKPPDEIIQSHDGKCPACGKKLSFIPKNVEVKASEETTK